MISIQASVRNLQSVLKTVVYHDVEDVALDPDFDFYGNKESVLWLIGDKTAERHNYLRRFTHQVFAELAFQDVKSHLHLNKDLTLNFNYFLPYKYDNRLFSGFSKGYLLIGLGIGAKGEFMKSSLIEAFGIDILHRETSYEEKLKIAQICSLSLPVPKTVHEGGYSPYLFYLQLLGVPVQEIPELMWMTKPELIL